MSTAKVEKKYFYWFRVQLIPYNAVLNLVLFNMSYYIGVWCTAGSVGASGDESCELCGYLSFRIV